MQVKSDQEWQFDGLVGPTHNYAGLAAGNLASATYAGSVSSPQKAALEGLRKMRFVRDLGVNQAVLPPSPRPILKFLQDLGFGSAQTRKAAIHMIERAHAQAPELFAAAFSSSFMWAANAATITPSADAADGRLHLTPANLISHVHRSLEAEATHALLRRLFPDASRVAVHAPLPATLRFSDEGAANHMRVQGEEHTAHVFVYGESAASRFMARQQRAACEAIARRHGIMQGKALFWQQHPEAIDSGVFHNDVIAMSCGRLMIAHAQAFVGQAACVAALQAQLGEGFRYVEIPSDMLSVKDAVASYVFNSQLLQLGERTVLIAPEECREIAAAARVIAYLHDEARVLDDVHYQDVRESMKNGGGPACLRLRVPMTEAESAGMHQGVVLTDARDAALSAVITRHYRDRLSFDDLRDPALLDELEATHEALTAALL